MTKILLDTDIVINLLKKDQLHLEKFLSLDNDGAVFYCNPIVVAEIYAGAFQREIISINQERENRYISQLFSDEQYFTLSNAIEKNQEETIQKIYKRNW